MATCNQRDFRSSAGILLIGAPAHRSREYRPVVAPNTSPVPVEARVTAASGTRLPSASSTVTVTVVVATPFAATVAGAAATLEVAAEAAPELTVVVSWTAPSPAVMVSPP
jgi:hypothetical protein